MCLKHLLGEHVEHHMFVGTLQKRKSVKGYLENNLLEPQSLIVRHAALAQEIDARGYSHASPLEEPDLSYLSAEDREHKINKQLAELDLFQRCTECQLRAIALETHLRHPCKE
jgi:hypothetical protein